MKQIYQKEIDLKTKELFSDSGLVRQADAKGQDPSGGAPPPDSGGNVKVNTGTPQKPVSAPAISGNIMDACRILWAQATFADTPRIQKYLPAVISALHAGEFCMPDAECLMDKSDPAFKNQRSRILENEKFKAYHRRHYAHLASVLGGQDIKPNAREYEGFLPTINRLEPFMDPTMKLLFGSRQGLDFKKLIAENYLVLVNLDPEGVWGTGSPEQRLLGTIIINEITHAISRLRNSGWQGVYYLYIDEAGDYATSKLSYILDKKRKSGLRLTLSHQRFDQFSDKYVSSAVYGGTKIKVLFNTPSRDDRDRMIRMMFGGELSDRDVSYHLQDTPKQNCWIKNNKQKPQKVRILDLPDATWLDGRDITRKDLTVPLSGGLAYARQARVLALLPQALPTLSGASRARLLGRGGAFRPSRLSPFAVKTWNVLVWWCFVAYGQPVFPLSGCCLACLASPLWNVSHVKGQVRLFTIGLQSQFRGLQAR